MKASIVILTSFACITLRSVIGFAGDGYLDTSGPLPHKFNLTVSIRYTADPQQIAQWQGEFQAASDRLLDATDGQHCFGTITVYPNYRNAENADVFIVDGSGNPMTMPYPRNSTNGLGHDGQICLSKDFRPVNLGQQWGPVIAHEFGHYAYGLYDEYPRYAGYWCEAPCRLCCNGCGTHTACLMEDPDSRNEFCVEANHGHNNWQQFANGGPCWETMHAYFSDLVVPNPVPNDPAPPSVPIEWIPLVSTSRLVLCLDRSGSMAGLPIEEVKIAAGLSARLAADNSCLSVVSFSTSAAVDFSMQQIYQDRSAVLSAINNISTGGNTSFGAGLGASLDQITGQGERAAEEVVIFMSDGHHNTPPTAESVLPSLVARGVRVNTIAFGIGADASSLAQIAAVTGGNFYNVSVGGTQRSNPYPDDIVSTMANVLADATQVGTVDRTSDRIIVGDTQQWPYRIEPYARFADFVINWDTSAGRINLSLITPSGTLLVPADSSGTVQYAEDLTSGYAFFRIQNPEAGEWIMRLSGAELTANTSYHRQVRVDNPRLYFAVHEYSDATLPTDTVLITASVTLDYPVTNLTITAEVVSPESTMTAFPLWDDGNPNHGDQYPNDGVYSQIFRPTISGTFNVYVHADNSGQAQYADPVQPYLTPGDTIVHLPQQPIPMFQRFATLSFVGEGSSAPVCECRVENTQPGPLHWSYSLANLLISTCNQVDLTIDTECDWIDSCTAPDGWVCQVVGRRVTFATAGSGVAPNDTIDGFTIYARHGVNGRGVYLVGTEACSDSIDVPVNQPPSLQPVTDLVIQVSDNQNDIVLNWSRPQCADSFQVYAGHSSDFQVGVTTRIGTTPDTTFTHVNGLMGAEKRFYAVGAIAGPADMVLIPAGPYDMGADYGEPPSLPIHTVNVPAFYMDIYEVTNAQYKAFCDATSRAYPLDPGFYVPNYFSDPAYENYPVVNVYWQDAKDYASWRGAGYRLPTEAEWERAAKGNTDNRLYPWGDTWVAANANVSNNPADGYTYTAPVGSYPNGISPAGCYDMAGNVWEWCEDDFHYNYNGAPTDGSAWIDNPRGSTRVNRGGSWYGDSSLTRCAGRGHPNPPVRAYNIGFRCARTP